MRQNTTLKVMKTFKTSRGSLMLWKGKFKSRLVCALRRFVLRSAVVGRFLILWNALKGLTNCFRTMSRKFLLTNTHKIAPQKEIQDKTRFFFHRRATGVQLSSRSLWSRCYCGYVRAMGFWFDFTFGPFYLLISLYAHVWFIQAIEVPLTVQNHAF